MLSSPLAQAQTPSANQDHPSSPSAPAPAKASDLHFDILEYDVDGNTTLPTAEIEEAVYPFLGEQRTAADVDKARDALQAIYAAKGYQTVQVSIPQQGIETGIIHLQVAENPVGRLRIVGSKYHSLDAIKAEAPSLAEGIVPSTAQLQQDIVALNSETDLKVTPRLIAGRTPGTVDVDLDVEDHLPLHGSIEINNQHNEQTQPLRLLGTISYANLWQLGHSISLSYQIAPQKPGDAQVFSGSYLVPLPRDGLSFLLYGVQSNSNVAAIAGTNVVGRGGIIGVRAIKDLPGDQNFYDSVTIGIDRKDLTQNVITDDVPSNAPVLYYPLTLSYSATVQNGDTTTQADASINTAIPGLNSNSLKFEQQRDQARPDYIYFKADASRTQPLPLGLVGYVRADGQITGDALLSSEQYSGGGLNTVRGYLESERLGDYGAHATFELRSPSIAAHISPRINEWRFLTFFDGATVLMREPLADEKASYRLASTGIGTYLTAFDSYFNAVADLAFPLIDGDVTKAGRPVVNFRVWSEF